MCADARSHRRQLPGAVLAVVVLAGAGLGLVWWIVGDPIDETFVVPVRRGPFSIRLTETGTLRPAQTLTYRSPLVGREAEVTFLAPEGTHVQSGDLLVSLDTTELEFELERARQTLRQAEVELQVADVEHQEAVAAVESMTSGAAAIEVDEERLNLELAEKRAAQLRNEYESLQPLLDRGFITKEELDRVAFEVDQAEAELVILRRRTEIFVEQTFPRDTIRAQLQQAQREAQLENARARLQEGHVRTQALEQAITAASMHARRPGLVVYEQYMASSPRRKVRIGDRVTSTQGLVTIPEVDQMLVESSVREVDLHRVRRGLPVDITLDAFPNRGLTGTVLSIGALASELAERRFEEKRFDLVVRVDVGEADLRPEMTARINILVEERDDVLLVPVNAVFSRSGSTVSYVVRRNGVDTREVELGSANEQYVEVLAGLNEGDRVALVDMGDADRDE